MFSAQFASIQQYVASHPFAELGVVILIVIIVLGVMRILRQPIIMGYILVGIILSPQLLDLISHRESIEMFSHIGVAFLLFMVGLGLNPRIIKDVGKVSVVTGLGQIVFTSLVGFLIATGLGFDIVTSLYVAVALTFSSTIVIVKLLSDKGDTEKLYGKIATGLLIVQDIVAVLILMIVSTSTQASVDTNIPVFIGLFIVKAAMLFGVLFLLSKYVLPRVTKAIAHSKEYLLLFAIGRCMILAGVFDYLGFSLEIGALIAGFTLAVSPFRFEIMSKMKPLRDFFLVMFFVFLGMNLYFGDISSYILPIILFSLFVLIGNPLIVMTLMGLLGYRKKNGLLTGLTCAQISEFSFILMALGLSAGHITDSSILSMVTIIGLLTIGGSSYFITYSGKLYNFLSPYLHIFEKKGHKHDEAHAGRHGKDYDAVLFGFSRVGIHMAQGLGELDKKYLVVDSNPDVIAKLEKQKVPSLYGDAGDMDLLEEIHLKSLHMAIVTIHDFDVAMFILQKIKEVNKKALIIVLSHDVDEAIKLYEEGADYVILPHFMGGHQASLLLQEFGFDQEKFIETRIKHINTLKKHKSDIFHNLQAHRRQSV